MLIRWLFIAVLCVMQCAVHPFAVCSQFTRYNCFCSFNFLRLCPQFVTVIVHEIQKPKMTEKNCQSQKFIDCIRNYFFLGFVAKHSSLYRTWAKFMCCRRVRCTNVTKFARMYLSLTRIGMYKSPPNKKTHQNKSEHAELQEYPVWLFDCNPTSTINNQHNNQK